MEQERYEAIGMDSTANKICFGFLSSAWTTGAMRFVIDILYYHKKN